jgi:hypothetical protein
MANSWSITIKQQDGVISFTPAIPPDAKPNQPQGVNKGDNVTWNNQTNLEIELISIDPKGVFLCNPIPPGRPSNPIFNVQRTVKYSRVLQGAPAGPDLWIVVV